MTATGGSIIEVSINGRIYPVAADSESNRDLGGFTTEIEANGDGSARKVKTRRPWKVDGLTIEIDDSRGDQEALQAISDGDEDVAISVTYANNVTYSGKGTVTGEFASTSKNATAPVTLSGSGTLRKQ
jgi:hypothetical protein